MNKKDLKKIAQIDNVAEDGCYTIQDYNRPKYDLRKVLKEQERLGRELMLEEFKKYET